MIIFRIILQNIIKKLSASHSSFLFLTIKRKGFFFLFLGGGGVWGGVEEEGEDAASLVVCLCDHSDTFVVSLYSIGTKYAIVLR